MTTIFGVLRKSSTALVILALAPSTQAQVRASEYGEFAREAFALVRRDPLRYASDLPKLGSILAAYRAELRSNELFGPGGNPAVLKYRDKVLSENQCLADAAVEAFARLTEAEIQRRFAPLDPAYEEANGYPSLRAKTKPPESGKQSLVATDGWAWRLALEVARGDANVAIMSLSTWTHDDRHAALTLASTAAVSPRSVERLRQLREQLRDLYGDDLTRLIVKIDDGVVLNFVTRPPQLFVPGSLSAEADISDALKSSIVSAQAPTQGAAVLPAKYYHVYGGASAACEFRNRGLSADMSVMLVAKSAELYRARRLAATLNPMIRELSELTVAYDARPDLTMTFREFLAEAGARAMNGHLSCGDATSEKLKDPACTLATGNFGSLPRFFEGKRSPEQIQKFVSAAADQMLAARVILAKSQPSGDRTNFNEHSFELYPLLQALSNDADRRRCDGLSDNDCSRARRTIASWKIDFDWTIAAQRAGAVFGARVCSPTSLEEMNRRCETLNLAR